MIRPRPLDFGVAMRARGLGAQVIVTELDPTKDVLYGPMLDIRFSERFERFLAWIGPQHKVMGSSGIGRITAANPRARFVGDPVAGVNEALASSEGDGVRIVLVEVPAGHPLRRDPRPA